ncbi:hypothetical protein SCH4B_1537 [Ruegeria sp. TrichCH4B]|nr:hypothetical protein SCH4B_1537 [Ruegeria sp. TrichCH4B]
MIPVLLKRLKQLLCAPSMQRTLPTATGIPRFCTIFWQFVNFFENESLMALFALGRAMAGLFLCCKQPLRHPAD